ncbi:MAG TPA: amino acid adenylation domain-containing protein [Candidatus Dormibacteraeota bacterium]
MSVAPRLPDGERPRPLSPAQRRLWLVRQLDPEMVSNHVAAVFRLRGRLDVGALDRALTEIGTRHQVLRATFHEHRGTPVQIVGPPPASVLRVRRVAGPDPEIEARRAAEAEAFTIFDLGRGPVWRSLLLRVTAEDHLLVLSFDHIVFDAPSFGLVAAELSALYAAFSAGLPSPLPPLSVQYPDFALWQQRRLAAGAARQHLAHWRRHLRGAPARLELATDRPRPARRRSGGGVLVSTMPEAVVEGVRSLARSQRTTPFAVLLTAFAVLLSRSSGQSRVVVGVPVSGRTRTELEALVGCFLNVLCLHLDLTGDPSFAEALHRAWRSVMAGFAHQELPFEQLVEELQPERSPSHHPLFQVLFSTSPPSSHGLLLPGIHVQEIPIEGGGLVYDLSVDLAEDGHAMRGLWGFDDALFDHQTVARMARRLDTLTAAATAHPDLPISRLPLLDHQERSTISSWASAAPPDRPRTVPDLVAEQARARPHACAVRMDGEVLTYARLLDDAGRLAAHLRHLGAGPEAPVAVLLERSPRLPTALLAVLMAGAPYVPLDPDHPPQRIALVLDDARPAVVLSQRSVIQRLHIQTSAPLLELDALTLHRPPLPHQPLHPQSLAYLIYTSGTTGRPKGVAVQHHALANNLAALGDLVAIDHRDVTLAVTTVGFDIAALELLLPLVRGASLVIASREQAVDGHRLAQLIDHHQVTLAQATPVTFRTLLDAGWRPPPGLRILCGGEALPPALAARLASARAWNVYGPTEATIWSTAHPLSAHQLHSIPIGRPIAGTSAHVLDRLGRPLPIGVPGELHLGGHGVARGYARRPQLTAERFLPDPLGPPGSRLYRTGDLARWLPDGSLEFLGRIDSQVKVRGFRVELAEVEAALELHPDVDQAAVALDQQRQRLLAYLVCPQQQPDPAQLRAHLAGSLPDYMLPALFTVLHALPRNTNGKLDRGALPPPQDDHLAPAAAYAPPTTPAQELMAAVWAQALGLERVGVDDDFFELGGHSLLAVQIAARLRHALGVDLPPWLILEEPTISRLEPRLRTAGRGRPLHLVHAIGGSALPYAALARHLGADRPVLGLEAPGLEPGGAPAASIAALAAHHLATLDDHPLLLGGWSMGGLVAFEMARQLQAGGAPLPTLVLLDPPAPAPSGWAPTEADAAAWFAHDLARTAGALPPGTDPDVAIPLMRVFHAHLRALASYRPEGPFAGDALLIRAAGEDTAPAWRELIGGRLEVRTVDADHYAMLRDPDAAAVAALIEAFLH